MSKFHARLSSRKWQRTRKAAFERDGYRCQVCKKHGKLEAHHVIEIHKGGDAWALNNVISACRDCHRKAHSKPESPARAGWRALVSELLNS